MKKKKSMKRKIADALLIRVGIFLAIILLFCVWGYGIEVGIAYAWRAAAKYYRG